jgi:hypothetical protein
MVPHLAQNPFTIHYIPSYVPQFTMSRPMSPAAVCASRRPGLHPGESDQDPRTGHSARHIPFPGRTARDRPVRLRPGLTGSVIGGDVTVPVTVWSWGP